MKATVEHERKLDAPEGFELPELGGEPLEARVFTSVYHDTPARSLTRAGITLRRRLERGQSAWQLKLPAADARLELEEPGGPAGPPPRLARLLTTHLRRGPVAPVAELRTRRHGTLVTRHGSSAEVTVDEVAVMDALRVEATFVEVEVELTSGDPRKLGAIVKKLTAAGARPSDGTPKVFRALGIARPSAERPAEPIEALRTLLRAQVTEILAHDPGTRLGRDPESLHDMRVATRRLRALLRAGGALFTNDVEALTAELKWLGEVLGAVRDLDVLLDRLRGEAATLDAEDAAAATRLLAALERRRSRARRTLLKALGGERYLRLVDHLDETIDSLVPAETELTLPQLAATQLRNVRRAARGLGGDAPDAALHDLRKRAKRMRYAHELSGDDVVVKRAKALQDVLGEHQDAVVAEACLRELAAGAEPAEAIAAGLLIARERERRELARDAWPAVWRKLARSAT